MTAGRALVPINPYFPPFGARLLFFFFFLARQRGFIPRKGIRAVFSREHEGEKAPYRQSRAVGIEK